MGDQKGCEPSKYVYISLHPEGSRWTSNNGSAAETRLGHHALLFGNTRAHIDRELSSISNLAVQQRRHVLTEIPDNGVGSMFVQTLGDGMQLDRGIDRACNIVNLLGLLGGPHRGAELEELSVPRA